MSSGVSPTPNAAAHSSAAAARSSKGAASAPPAPPATATSASAGLASSASRTSKRSYGSDTCATARQSPNSPNRSAAHRSRSSTKWTGSAFPADPQHERLALGRTVLAQRRAETARAREARVRELGFPDVDTYLSDRIRGRRWRQADVATELGEPVGRDPTAHAPARSASSMWCRARWRARSRPLPAPAARTRSARIGGAPPGTRRRHRQARRVPRHRNLVHRPPRRWRHQPRNDGRSRHGREMATQARTPITTTTNTTFRAPASAGSLRTTCRPRVRHPLGRPQPPARRQAVHSPLTIMRRFASSARDRSQRARVSSDVQDAGASRSGGRQAPAIPDAHVASRLEASTSRASGTTH